MAKKKIAKKKAAEPKKNVKGGRKVKTKKISLTRLDRRSLTGPGRRTKKIGPPKRKVKPITNPPVTAKQLNEQLYHRLWNLPAGTEGLAYVYWQVAPHELAKETIGSTLTTLRGRLEELESDTNDERRAWNSEICEHAIEDLEEHALGDDFPIILIHFDPAYKDPADEMRLANLRMRLLHHEKPWAKRLDDVQALVDKQGPVQ